MEYEYRNRGTCSMGVKFELEGNIVRKVKFIGGCSGNTQGIARLVEGMTVEEIEKRLRGIRCGGKPTSCPDQLANAVRRAYDEANR